MVASSLAVVAAKLAGQTTLVILSRGGCVERTFPWINRYRQTNRDYERLPDHHTVMVHRRRQQINQAEAPCI